jgi:hypothetical protein
VNSSVTQEKACFWTVTGLIKRCAKKIERDSHSTKITFLKEDFYRMLIAEVSLFQIKRMRQHECMIALQKSANWKFVTLYYDLFFSSFILLLFLHRGFVFIDDDSAKLIEDLLNQTSSNDDVFSFPKGNYFFWAETQECEDDDQVVVSFAPRKDNTHEALWKTLPDIVKKEIYEYADTDEKAIYGALNEYVKTYGATFPSQTRNFYNYSPLSAKNDIKNQILFVYEQDRDLIKDALRFQIKKDDGWPEKAQAAQYYREIISLLTNYLYNEYISRGNEKNEFYQFLRSRKQT